MSKLIHGYRPIYSINDLYIPEGFLNNFEIVEFHNIYAFVEAVKGNFYKFIGQARLHIENGYELRKLIPFLEANLHEVVDLYIYYDLLKDPKDLKLLKKYKGIKYIGIHSDIFKDLPDFQEIRRNNVVAEEIMIDSLNYDVAFDIMIDYYMNYGVRFFLLDWDWESFEDEFKMEDLHDLYFRISRFITFANATKEKKGNLQPIEILDSQKGFRKKIYVGCNLNLWYNFDHYLDFHSDPLFQLKRDFSGEDIPFRELSLIRQYVDIEPKSLVTDVHHNYFLIDYYQNFNIQRVINEVPYITQFVQNIWWSYHG